MTEWFEGIPLAGNLSDEELAKKTGEAVPTPGTRQTPGSNERFAFEWLVGVPAWRHTSHTYGFIPPGDTGPGAIRHVSEIPPDPSLRDTRLRISLDGLRVANYPGGGIHRVLFNFFVQNRTRSGTEDVNFNATYRIREGESAGVLNYPIFTGVAPQPTGLVIRCFTVNVRNDNDEAFLDLLESDAIRKGLKLAATAQPVLGPLSSLAVGMTRTIAARHRNVAVQDVYLGLDFGGAATGARLAVGSYVAVQIPSGFARTWRWSDWSYDANSGQILNASGEMIPLNYFVIGVSPSPS
ncbi:hypothetical protein [Streptomyces sp. NPDC004270]